MRKTALSIIQQTLYRLNQPAPSALVGITTVNVLQILEELYEICEDLRQSGIWIDQKRKHSFSTSSTVSQYLLPADYYCPLPETEWNQAENWKLIGPVSDEEFTYYLHSGHTPGLNYYFRLFNWDQNRASTQGQIELTPTPTSTQTLSFEYATRHLFLPKDYALSQTYTLNTLVNVNGEIYKCSDAITTSTTPPTGKTTGIVDGDGTWDWYNTPIESLLADTDLCLYDSDLVRLGLRAFWLQDNAGAFEQAQADYEAKKETARGRYKGSRVGTFVKHRVSSRYGIPYRSWSL